MAEEAAEGGMAVAEVGMEAVAGTAAAEAGTGMGAGTVGGTGAGTVVW
jgi:hypothetical protein